MLQHSRVSRPKPTEEKYVPPNLIPAKDFADFVLLKRQLQTYYSIQSKEENLPFEKELCHHPTCLQLAVPTLHYCAYHLIRQGNHVAKQLVKDSKKKK